MKITEQLKSKVRCIKLDNQFKEVKEWRKTSYIIYPNGVVELLDVEVPFYNSTILSNVFISFEEIEKIFHLIKKFRKKV